MNEANALMLSGSLGSRELMLAAAIVLLLVVAPRLLYHSRRRTETAASRAYLDRLFGASLAERIRPALASRGQAPLSREDT